MQAFPRDIQSRGTLPWCLFINLYFHRARDGQFHCPTQKSSGKKIQWFTLNEKLLCFYICLSAGPSLHVDCIITWLCSPVVFTHFLHLTLWNTAELSVSAFPRKSPNPGAESGKEVEINLWLPWDLQYTSLITQFGFQIISCFHGKW